MFFCDSHLNSSFLKNLDGFNGPHDKRILSLSDVYHRRQDIKREKSDLAKGVSLVRLYASPTCRMASA